MKYFLLNTLLCITICATFNAAAQSTIAVSGKHIIGPCGDTLLLRGVNYAPYNWGYSDTELFIDQIALTGANCVRLVWYKNNPVPAVHAVYSNYELLDSALSKCIQNDIVPILELHDLTCVNDPAALISLAEWYEEPAVFALIEKYKHSLIVNVANEALYVSWTGDVAAGKTAFINAYTTVVTNMRHAGITTPIMIDGPECGNNLNVLADMATTLQANDPQHNLIFSAHAYWWAYDSMDSATSRTMVEYAEGKNFPLVFGEIANYQDDPEPCNYALPYKALLNILQEKKIGWLAWSWNNDRCAARQLTTAGSTSSLTTFGTDILTNSNYGLNTMPAAKSQYLVENGCITSTNDLRKTDDGIRVFPNPAHDQFYLEIAQASDDTEISVSDIRGRKIVYTTQALDDGRKYLISVGSNLPAGIYLLHVRNERNAVVKSLVIQ